MNLKFIMGNNPTMGTWGNGVRSDWHNLARTPGSQRNLRRHLIRKLKIELQF